MNKTFSKYEDAYELYSAIVAGREPDRTNASIVMTPEYQYMVCWTKKD